MNKQTGITLIALVITIIVLLILAGVSISLIVGENGVLNQVSTSVLKTREAEAREEVEVAWASMETDYIVGWTKKISTVKDGDYIKNKLDTYLAGTGEIVEGTFKYADGTCTFKYKPNDDNLSYNITKTTNGRVIAVGETGVESGGSSDTSVDYLGKYVKYDANENGSVEDETILWRVLRNDADKVELITADALGTLDLSAKNLNEARTNYNNAISLIVQTCKDLTGIPSVRNVGGPASEEEQLSDSNTIHFNEYDGVEEIFDYSAFEGIEKGFRNGDNNYEKDWNQMQLAGVTQTESESAYWLASRELYLSGPQATFVWMCPGIRYCDGKESITGWNKGMLYITTGGGHLFTAYIYNYTAGVRPVLTLPSGILEGKTEAGTVEQPIVIIPNN